jgi:hypothetical protein
MVPGSNFKRVWIVPPQAIKDDTDWVGTTASTPRIIDTAGFAYMKLVWALGASDIDQASLIVVSDDDSALGSATTRYTFGGTGKMALPTATDDNKFWDLGIDLNGNPERYWGVTAKAGNGSTGAYAVCWVELYRGDEVPISDTQRNIADSDYI